MKENGFKHALRKVVPILAVGISSLALVLIWKNDLKSMEEWHQISFIVFTHFLLGTGLFLLCYHFSFRWLPNLAIAGAWSVMIIIFETSVRNYYIVKDQLNITVPTFITLLKEAYESSKIGSGFIKTFMELYGVGIFGTVFISMATEATKSLWSDEIRSAENKTLLAKFKRARRQRILARNFLFFKMISVVYIHMVFYLVVLLCTSIATIVLSSTDITIIRIDIILLLMSVTLEAMGVATHFIITDQTLAASETKYLQQKQPAVNRKLKRLSRRNSSSLHTCKIIVLSPEVTNYLQILVHSYCNHSSREAINKSHFYPKTIGCCKLLIAKNLIARFYRTNEIYIAPNQESYYTSASSHFEPNFAIDLRRFLFGNDVSKPSTPPRGWSASSRGWSASSISVMDALSICQNCMFAIQRKKWEDWLYPTDLNYEQMVSQVMLDLIRICFVDLHGLNEPCYEDYCEGNHSISNCALLLEIPFIIKLAIVKRMRDKSFPDLNNENKFELWFRERTEQYYYNLFESEINCYTSKQCNQIGTHLAQALTARHDGSDFLLQRVLPINSNNYTDTRNKPDFSLKLSCKNCFDATLIEKKTAIPGWRCLFKKIYIKNWPTKKNSVDKNGSSTYDGKLEETDYWDNKPMIIQKTMERLTAYDRKYSQSTEGLPSYGFCEDKLEQCKVLSYIIFESGAE